MSRASESAATFVIISCRTVPSSPDQVKGALNPHAEMTKSPTCRCRLVISIRHVSGQRFALTVVVYLLMDGITREVMLSQFGREDVLVCLDCHIPRHLVSAFTLGVHIDLLHK